MPEANPEANLEANPEAIQRHYQGALVIPNRLSGWFTSASCCSSETARWRSRPGLRARPNHGDQHDGPPRHRSPLRPPAARHVHRIAGLGAGIPDVLVAGRAGRHREGRVIPASPHGPGCGARSRPALCTRRRSAAGSARRRGPGRGPARLPPAPRGTSVVCSSCAVAITRLRPEGRPVAPRSDPPFGRRAGLGVAAPVLDMPADKVRLDGAVLRPGCFSQVQDTSLTPRRVLAAAQGRGGIMAAMRGG